MTESILFTTYLHRCIEANEVSLDRLQQEMGYRDNARVRSWLQGRSRPPIWQLPVLAEVLEADPVEVVIGWVVDQCPEFDEVFRKEILRPRGLVFPRHSDPDIHLPKPMKPVSR